METLERVVDRLPGRFQRLIISELVLLMACAQAKVHDWKVGKRSAL